MRHGDLAGVNEARFVRENDCLHASRRFSFARMCVRCVLTVAAVEPLASLDPDRLIAALAPNVQCYLIEPLPERTREQRRRFAL